MSNEYLTAENIRTAVKSLEAASTRPVTATIGQYADYFSMSDMWFGMSCYCCGQNAKWSGDHHALCDGCHFRHTVMKAAGREEEFWASGSPKPSPLGEMANEMSYRLGASLDAMIKATADGSVK